MKLENRTRYRSADLEAIILRVLDSFGIAKHGRDRVVVQYGRVGFSGCAYVGPIMRWNGHARMRLRLPDPAKSTKAFDVAAFVWLVRHEVAHWSGLHHPDMAPTLRRWAAWEAAGRPVPVWAEGMTVAIEDAPSPPAKPRPTADARREAKLQHAQEMLARARRKAALAETLVRRWERRARAAERAIAVAATRVPKESSR